MKENEIYALDWKKNLSNVFVLRIIQRKKYKERDMEKINKENEEDKIGKSVVNNFWKL